MSDVELPDANTFPHLRLVTYDQETGEEIEYEKEQYASIENGKVVKTWFQWKVKHRTARRFW